MTDLFIGTWELDPSTLDYESGRPGRRATYVVEAIPGGLMFTIDGEDADGRAVKFRYGGPMDGTGRPLPGTEFILVLRRTGERCIESVLQRGEAVLDRWVRELSSDGRSIQMTQFVSNPGGADLLNTSVYRRVSR